MADLDVNAEIARLREENARLTARMQAQARAKVSLKVSDKGGVSVYGLGRFPVTLYASQWRTLLASTDLIAGFLADHAGELTEKS